jgi:uncharacterized repeat protein (TIGR01451 family)
MTFSLRLLMTCLAAGALLLAGSAPVSGAPVVGSNVLYTVDADFDQGTLVNVNHDAPNSNQLQLNSSSGTFPFIWIALSQRCTIAKVNTESGAILGEYRTISDSAGCNESSRTTVGIDGSVWVGHRGPGGVNHVGLSELNQCVDRNGNGTIETSSGYGDVEAWPGSDSNVANAVDECILHHVNTHLAPLSMGDSRHMSIDANNKLWVGDFAGGGKFVRINGTTGVVETTVRDHACGGYGGLIDGNGVIWSAQGSLLRWNPDAVDDATNPRCISGTNVYGLAVDGAGSVWASQLSGGVVWKVSPDGTIQGSFPHGSSNAQGLAVDSDGDVWVSSSLFCGSSCTIGHLKNDGTFVGSVPTPTGAGTTGVAVDASGKIWAAARNSNSAIRIDPDAGPLGCGGTGCADGTTRLGAVDLTVSFPASAGRPLPFPYNYSDMTGAQLFNSTAPQGSWTVVQDGGESGTAWGKITWNAEPQGSSASDPRITVEARAADSEAGLGSQSYVAVSNGAAFSLAGRFIQVRATLEQDEEGTSPVLSDLRICGAASACLASAPTGPPASIPPADMGVTKLDTPDPVAVGSNITYTMVATNHGPGHAPDAALSDVLPAGVTFVSASTTLGSCSFAAGTVRCSFGTLAVGQSATVTLVVRADQAGTTVNTAGVSTSVSDPNVANNQIATAVTTVQGAFTPPAAPPEPAAPSGCALTTGTPSVFAGVRSTIVVRARYDDGSARAGVALTLRGAGAAKTVRANAQGIARFAVAPKKAGRMTVRGPGCSSVLAVAAVMSRSCVGLVVTPKSATVGSGSALTVRVRIAGRAAVGVRVLARGAGLSLSAVTNSAGVATMRGTATRPGVVTVTVPGVLTCSKRVGVAGAFQPPEVTG